MLRLNPPSLRSPSLHTDAAGPAPDAFGPFRVLHQIGAGTLGPVFRAFDPETERLVAVKLFTLDLAPERVHQVVAELERLIAAALTHPAIAAPLAAGIRNNHAYLAMEYVSADSLDVAVRQYGAAPPAEALRVAAQLAGALDFAAVVHVAHGALHPRDVLLSPEETRLTGIGIAHAFETVNVAAPVRRPYTPPEGIAGAEWDRRADVFSLAALMHELLWGRRVSALGGQAGDALTDLPGGNLDALRTLFARALAERPDDRFDTALDFAQALTQAFPDVAIAAPRAREETAAPAAQAELPGALDARLPLDEPAPASVAPRPVKKVSRVRNEPPAPLEEPRRVEHEEPPVDLDLRAAEAARYEAVDAMPAIVDLPSDPAPAADRLDQTPSGLTGGYVEPPTSALERSRSALWPLALALIVGIAIGFAGGYGVGSHDRSAAPQAVAAVQTPAAAPTATAERAGTDGTVAKDGKEAPAPKEAQDAKSAPAKPVDETPAARAQAASGRLLVRSTPAGARVFVDGREGGHTPLAVRDLARGEHRVRIVHDGYAAEERRITITTSQPAQAITVPLARARVAAPSVATPIPSTPGTTGRFVGALTVDSRPPGAKVFIDGKLAGTTPLELAGLNAGEHVVRIERDGYRRWSSSVRVVASEQNRVTASLEK